MRFNICGVPVYLLAEMLLSCYMTMTLYLGICWVLFGPGSAIFWPTPTRRRCTNEYLFIFMQFGPRSLDLVFNFLENAIQAIWLWNGMKRGSVGTLKSQATSTFVGVIMMWIWNASSLFIYGSLDNVSIWCMVWSALCYAFRLFSAFIVYRYQSLLAECLARKSRQQQPGNRNNEVVVQVQLPTKKRKTNRQRIVRCHDLNQVLIA